MPELNGGSLCGAVRYTSNSAREFIGVCHCRDCQKYTGSAKRGGTLRDRVLRWVRNCRLRVSPGLGPAPTRRSPQRGRRGRTKLSALRAPPVRAPMKSEPDLPVTLASAA
jgi:hypothetical protein